MAISRILGASLVSNLDREGVDLQFTTSGNALVYMDFANFRLGINTNTPNQELEVNGNILVANGSVLSWANVSSDIGDSTNWFRTVYANTIQSAYLYGTLQTASQPNITSVGNLTALTVLGNIVAGNITTSGTIGITGNLTVDDVIADTITGTIVTADQPYIANLANIQVDSLTTLGNVSSGAVVTSLVDATDIYGTIRTADQPYISNLGNITVDSISIGGNITISGNTNGGVINADELYEAGYRVLTSNTNLVITGDATGSGTYTNIAITLADTGVVAGIYGAADDEYVDRVPKITVDSKGRITNISNVALTQIGNVSVIDTTISTSSNITIAPTAGYIFANNSVISNVADPISNQDAVTLGYLNTQLSSAANVLIADDSKIQITDTGVGGQIDITIDGNIVANIGSSATNFNTSVVVGNITINDRTISSNGNIIIDAQNSGIVQIAGADALGLPYGNVSTRPANPEQGYFRYNSESGFLEVFDGNTWAVPGAATITSETISPDGSSNAFVLTTNATTDGVIVSINGTMQQPISAYQVSGNVITFTEIPHDTDVIEVRHIAAGAVTISSLAGGTAVVDLSGGDVNVTGNIIPTANAVYNLGSSSLQWNDLYLSGSTIYLGNVVLKEVGGIFKVFGSDGTTPSKLQADDPTNTQDVVTLGYLQNQLSSIDTSIIEQDNTSIQIIDDGIDAGNIVIAVDGSNVATVGNNAVSLNRALLLSSALAVTEGGTGATTSADALNNLLPSGEQSGYILKTSGPGTYYWSSESGGGGATVGQELTTLRQSNVASSGQTVFDLIGIDYTPGAGQLRVYVNGVRQHPDAYEETSNVSYTLSQGVNAGTEVFAEIDAFSSFNNYANLTYASNIGNVSAVGLTVQGAIDTLETTKAPLASPVFTGYVKIANPLEVTEGGTGATTSADALNNLLPSGEQSGYVLKTSGPGTYYWASEGGGGGATVGQQLTTLRQANTATSGQSIFDLVGGVSYTPGTGQLRVYVNGVRQYPSEYSETSNVSYTITGGVNSGDIVLAEIDAFSTFDNYANLTYASNIGNIASSGLTVQSAIENLETNKAPLVNPVFTGNITTSGIVINGLTTLAETTEVLDTKSSVTGTVVHDFSTSAIWYYSNIAGNVTANITNVPTTDNRVTSVSIVINQGGTGYIVNGLQIDGAAQTIRWQANTVPTASTNQVDVFTFSLLRANSTWTVLGSATSHG